MHVLGFHRRLFHVYGVWKFILVVGGRQRIIRLDKRDEPRDSYHGRKLYTAKKPLVPVVQHDDRFLLMQRLPTRTDEYDTYVSTLLVLAVQ